MSKELFMAAHEQLVAEYLDKHPNATWNQAYEATADGAYEHMRESLADRIDTLRQREKDSRI